MKAISDSQSALTTPARNMHVAGSPGTHQQAALRAVLCGLVAALAWLIVLPFSSQASPTKQLTTLEGKLISLSGTGPALKTQTRKYPLSAITTYLFHTLQDKRLLDREVRLEGTLTAGGTFKVEELYTVRSGKLYRIRYYCETCNIKALEPGQCVCCQQPTELQEVPADPNDKNIIVDR